MIYFEATTVEQTTEDPFGLDFSAHVNVYEADGTLIEFDTLTEWKLSRHFHPDWQTQVICLSSDNDAGITSNVIFYGSMIKIEDSPWIDMSNSESFPKIFNYAKNSNIENVKRSYVDMLSNTKIDLENMDIYGVENVYSLILYNDFLKLFFPNGIADFGYSNLRKINDGYLAPINIAKVGKYLSIASANSTTWRRTEEYPEITEIKVIGAGPYDVTAFNVFNKE